MKTKNNKVLFLTQAAMIAALYVVLTYISNAFGLASGAVQIRLSEMLCILPFFTPAAIPGLGIGCFLSNLLTGCAPLDIVFGTAATLIGAMLAYCVRKMPYLVPIPNIVSNTVIVPWVLRFAYDIPDAIPYLMFTVGIGEVIAGGVLGILLLSVLRKYRSLLFQDNPVHG